tara:strand:- start:660 stop:842 length:183 start_codon:yes stop_codon:yes gene_type:complete
LNLDDTYRHAARLNEGGDAEFVLWKAGEHGHKVDYWHRMGDGWGLQFKHGGYDFRREYLM